MPNEYEKAAIIGYHRCGADIDLISLVTGYSQAILHNLINHYLEHELPRMHIRP